jgi:hypothetical protein
VDDRALGRVFNGTTQDFVGKRGGVPFTKKDVTRDVNHWVDVGQ